MKKLVITLALFCCIGIYSYGQSAYVVEGGYTYTRILTHSEYVSLGGTILDEEIPGAGYMSSVRTLSCDKNEGSCTNVSLTVNVYGDITAVTIPEQCDGDGWCVETTITGVFAYYNSELERIILR